MIEMIYLKSLKDLRPQNPFSHPYNRKSVVTTVGDFAPTKSVILGQLLKHTLSVLCYSRIEIPKRITNGLSILDLVLWGVKEDESSQLFKLTSSTQSPAYMVEYLLRVWGRGHMCI